ncbi:similar to Saccharomyces cerevisiae YLR152C Putative protein of unknown function [Maudiozyma barnettii]|uniref:Auxin efflux carrier component n=1 Tax=Maudiozyma barnettii TaxID=61262 RepID=A0A8H2VG28_9SACH|nr:uncharacterized protein KABA2_05S01518 [Kazachstania barnettii]CAB4254800.1 similar to Saccharomyces cerevisiae YLR152C Putative protein of unknown function [Kazachstania barnettii]CAD1782961.1 similar to Saccharomyces cerevisiae YLR152C Putative protein of unknown function [Kazachstania barnettii]
MSKIDLGAAIYIALKPIFKIYTIIFVGFLIAKYNIVSMENAKGISNMVVNAILPCLTFNKIVTNISWHDIKEVGVIILSAIILFSFGATGALITNYTTPVPKTFYWSFIFAGLFPNISDLPIAYTQSMGNGAIFTEAESEKGVAYSCIFLFTQSFLMMNFGMWRMVGLDFRDSKKDSEDLESQNTSVNISDIDTNQGTSMIMDEPKDNNLETTSQVPRVSISSSDGSNRASVLSSLSSNVVDYENGYFTGNRNYIQQYDKDTANQKSTTSEIEKPSEAHLVGGSDQIRRTTSFYSNNMGLDDRNEDNLGYDEYRSAVTRRRPRRSSIHDVISSFSAVNRIKTGELDLTRPLSMTEEVGRENTTIGAIDNNTEETGIVENTLKSNGDLQSVYSEKSTKWIRFKKRVSDFIHEHHLEWVAYFAINFCRPASLGALLGIICALVPWIKALFVPTYVHVHQAPDDLPVLNFLMDFTAYIGNACIPLGLLLLGGTLARLEVNSIPKGFDRSVVLMTVFRLIISPIIGVLWANKLYDMNWLDSRIGKFVMVLTWSMPCSTSQVYFTAFYTPVVGSHVQMDCLSVFFVAQYAILFITLSIVVTYTLKVDLNV